ncbi:hypothetical protein [Variovorax ginsengisoli]|uniref:DUF1376 domain-containing protein n=1 Tax=Variovorax ginsengisoli TaxID=363844 RepID=A0ABT8RZD2_9BURK|nr:hypothetical protein [Variovorax ginsengisoli]MDN8612765.1 hypothetical protein [Variovorax ginsengisoli]MDO1531935.1 hypothetical protein [Variovorax ginsengisoli]
MPNRILREGILTSERVEKLNWAEEVFYRRLMSVVDDFGRYYARPALLLAACYPLLLKKVSDSDIEKWLSACENAALVRVYPAQDGKRYLQLLDFKQQVRAATSKFPQPPDTCAADAQQMHGSSEASAHLGVSVSGGVSEGEGGNAAAPAGARAGFFEEFWKAYPKKVGKDAALRAFDKRKPTRELLDSMLAAIEVQRRLKKWIDDDGQYIPHPSTWLNEGRWQDEVATGQGGQQASDPDSRAAIEAEGIAKGIGPWDQLEQFPLYRARVRGARPAPGLDLKTLGAMAAQRQGVH